MAGNYLISGGSETVLVMWQLETGKKQFFPELTADIENICVSPTGASYAIRLANNSIIILSTTELKARAHIAGIQAMARRSTPVPCAVHPTTLNHLLLAAPASQPIQKGMSSQGTPFLQTFDIASGRHVDTQAITRNNVTSLTTGPDGQKLDNPTVQFLRLSSDGKWLATLESWAPPLAQNQHLASENFENRQAQKLRREVQLKFWQWDSTQSKWELATTIKSPHPLSPHGTPGRVFDLIPHPHGTGFVTIGEDSTVRIWRPKTRVRSGLIVTDRNKNPLVAWSAAHSIGLGHTGGTMGADVDDADLLISQNPSNARIAYSPDGSVIAATQQFLNVESVGLVHLINAQEGTVHKVQPNLYSGHIRALSMTSRKLLILSNTLTVWDLVTDTLTYRLNLTHWDVSLADWVDMSHMTVNPSDELVAVALPGDKQTQLLVLDPSDPEPVYSDEVKSGVTALIPVPGATGFIFLNSFAEVCILGPSGNAALRILRNIAPTRTPLDVKTVDENDSMQIDLPARAKAAPPQDDVLEFDEDDRPVVYPQKLEEALDSGPGALLPVKDIFWNVVGLFSKKPRSA
jgi:NET1-associated nuclear protein 1 (U3 small nucleolar RNA-associated protein 17)